MSHIDSKSRNLKKIVDLYLNAKDDVIAQGFAEEIEWQNSIQLSQLDECYFLREAAWVVLSSGMREAVIRKKFPAISAAFYFWQSSGQIIKNVERCKTLALKAFRHEQKINAIINIARLITELGFDKITDHIWNEGIKFIQTMPFMGPATSYHLAKNIGLDVIKPDRHLLRVAEVAGYSDPTLLCEEISASVGDRISVVDLVIWRFATLNFNYLEYFAL